MRLIHSTTEKEKVLSSYLPTVDEMLTAEEQALVERALGLHAYVTDSILPKLQDVAERQKFVEGPSDYLREAGAPGVDEWAAESCAAFDALFSEADVNNLDCMFCKISMGLVIFGVVAVGAIITAALIGALAAALAKFTGGISVVLGFIALAGIKAGIKLLGMHVDQLTDLICRHTNACP